MSTTNNDWNVGDADVRAAMLTAYALGELDAEAAAEVEARLAAEPGLAAELAAIRGLSGELEAAFAAEPAAADGLGPDRREVVEAEPGAEPVSIERASLVQWLADPRLVGAMAMAAALVLLALVWLPPSVGDGASEFARSSGTSPNEMTVESFLHERRAGDDSDDSDEAARRARARTSRIAGPADSAGAPPPSPRPAPGSRVQRDPMQPRHDPASPGAPTPEARSRTAEARSMTRTPPGEGLSGRALPEAEGRVAPMLGDIPIVQLPWQRSGRGESYAGLVDNAWLRPSDAPLSTFSVDVDTASYANVRRFLMDGVRPPADAVRIEELINAFDYDYPAPRGEHPFAVSIDAGPAPWAADHRLVRVGLKGLEIDPDERPAANLVFLVDVSGSMRRPNKIDLVRASLRLLLDELQPSDRVAIVTYAGQVGVALPSTPVTDQGRALIHAAIDGLAAGGSTNGAGGIEAAYRVAAANRTPGGVNRVILCTDGDFNVGISDPAALQSFIESKRETGIFLSAAGFGRGNYRDDTMERLSNHGNGIAFYIDSMREAERVFVRDITANLVTIAKDVKLQVDFNPARVQAYRLIGYANRMLRDEDFADDRVDAGEIGAGHTVTALYEIVPVGVDFAGEVDPSKYGRPDGAEAADQPLPGADSPEMLTVRVRYKQPERDESVRFDTPHVDAGAGLAETAPDFQFAAAVAGFGMLLRDSGYAGSTSWDLLLEIAAPAVAARDPHGDRREFLALIRAAKAIGG